MKKTLFISFFAILFITLCVSNEIIAGEKDKFVTIQVTDANGKAIQNAFVITSTVRYNRWQKGVEGTTDESGRCQLPLKAKTKATVRVVAADYEPCITTLEEAIKGVKMKPKETLSLLSYNVWEGLKQEDERKNIFKEWIKKYNPDIILFQEMNKFTDASLSEFAKSYGHPYSVLLKNTGYPTAISSKYPIEDIQRVLKGQTHGYIMCKTHDIRFFISHLSPFEVSTRENEIHRIIDHAAQYPDDKIIIAGDLNSYNKYDEKAYGSIFQSERLQYHPSVSVEYGVTDALLDNEYTDTYTLHSDGIFKATIPVTPAKNPANNGSRYDYIFANKNLAPLCVYSDILREKITDTLSDHYPMYIRIKIK